MNNLKNKCFFVILMLLNLIFLIKINMSLILTFLVYLLIFIIINLLLFKKLYIRYINIFYLFMFFTILIYFSQLNNLPNFFGFTGITDDSYFYSRAIDYYTTYKDLPKDFPVRGGDEFNIYIQNVGFVFYSYFLSRFAYIVELWKKIEPLDMIFVNTLVLSFLPIFTERLAYIVFKNRKIAKTSFLLVAFSPALMSDGLVLVRDGMAATFFIGMLYYYFKNNIFLLLFMFSFLFLIRAESGMQAIFVLLIIYFLKKSKTKKIILIILGIFLFIVILYLYKDKILSLTGGSLFYRKNYVDIFLANNGNGKEGSIYKIQQLNIFLRIPLSMLAFYLSPALSLKRIFIDNIFMIRWFFHELIYPLINIFCIGYFTKMLFSIKKDKNLKFIFFSFLFLLYFVSQFSFQGRHKTLYMPLYYILCSYGIHTKNNISKNRNLKKVAVFLTVILYFIINFV